MFLFGRRIIWTLALRNLSSHKVKSLIVGFIMLFGTFLVVLGTALLDTVEGTMAESITGSLSGHVQVYSKKAKDELALYGGAFMGADDVGRIDRFEDVRRALEGVDNVKAVVPMGIDFTTVTSQGELERALASLRDAVHAKDPRPVPALKAQITEIVELMRAEMASGMAIAEDKKKYEEGAALLDEVLAPGFWGAFDADPLGKLELLDTKVAPLSEEGRLLYFRFIGTDLEQFAANFSKFQIVKGENVPIGRRGFLFNDKFYEDWVKNYTARGLDRIRRGVAEESKTIADDPGLQALVRQTSRQHERITYQLDPEEAADLEAKLRSMLPEVKGGLSELVQAFLAVDDQTIEERYAFFYREIAPKIQLYDVDVGDTITLRSFSRSGFLTAVNIKLYGTFEFEGLEKSELAGGHSLADIVTFRELYGLMTDAKRAELADIRHEVGLEDVERGAAEDALFGDASPIVDGGSGDSFDEFAGVSLTSERDRKKATAVMTYTKKDVDDGLALNAAVILEDPSRMEESIATISEALAKAGLEMNVIDWQSATGMVGQFIIVIRVILYIAILIIFLVALVIINNSMVMATMERVTEIGTMRAIGAQRRLVLSMFLVETVVLGLIAGALGSLLAAMAVAYLHSIGIPARSDVMVVLFGGPRLYPEIAASNVVFGMTVILFVSLVSTLYPAYLAAQIQPVMAMRSKE
jgi:ABC-type lipoprotein release transport system permease subunit